MIFFLFGICLLLLGIVFWHNIQKQKILDVELHDLKNTLVVLQSLTDMWQNNQKDSALALSYMNLIKNSCLNAQVQIDELFAHKRRKQKLSVICVNEVLKTVLDMWQRALPKNVVLSAQLPASSTFISGNAVLLQRMLNNLLQNAQRALPQGGHINVICKDAELSDEDLKTCFIKGKKGKNVEIIVEDDGIGLKPDLIKNLFKPYFSLHFQKGLGLGLFMLKKSIKFHKASLKVENKTQGGCCFRLYFPKLNLNCENVKILVVDDDAMQCALLKEFLKKENFRVFTATSAVEAIDTFSNNTDIQLLISDMRMPVMSGNKLFEKLQQLKPELKAIFLSGKKQSKFLKYARFLQKPYHLDEVKDEVLSLLAK